MSSVTPEEYEKLVKKSWIVYGICAVILASVLVLFVARDAEEMFFYGIMVPAGAYVLRPTERSFSNLIKKFTGVEKPAAPESSEG